MGKKQAHTAKVRAREKRAHEASENGIIIGPMGEAEVGNVAKNTERLNLNATEETLREIQLASRPGWRK